MKIRLSTTLTLAIALGFGSVPTIGASAGVCLSRDIISDRLQSRHAELPSAAGLATNGQVLEVFTSQDGSWTLILTDAHGVSCVIASGDAWTTLDQAIPSESAPRSG